MRPTILLSTASSLAMVWASAGTAHALGERDLIDGFVPVPSNVMTVVGDLFPESRAVGATYLSNAYSPNLIVTESATVSVTFIHEGAGYKNSLGYFTYQGTGATIQVLDRQLVFPNASYDPGLNLGWGGGTLVPGDTVTLRDENGAVRLFSSGTRIGFFLVANGWSGTSVAGWNEQSPALPYSSPESNQPIAKGVFTTLDELNPEVFVSRPDVSRHTAMVLVQGMTGFLGGEDYVLVGFEDLRRDINSDEDFNDLVFITQSTPPQAVQTTNVQTYDPNIPDPDGDGVEGLNDQFPNDPERAFIVRTPPIGLQTLVFEDNYPALGDADYNDVVVEGALEQVLSAAGQLKDLVGTYHLVARGANHDHRFGVSIPGVPPATTGTIDAERVSFEGVWSQDAPDILSSFIVPDAQSQPTLRLDHLFPSTKQALPPEAGTNTTAPTPTAEPASVRFVVTFDTAIAPQPLGSPPFDSFIQVVRGSELWDVHLTGKPAFPDRPGGLPDESGSLSFTDESSQPWALLVPVNWRYPLEKVAISFAYPTFDTWTGSLGSAALTWYDQPSTSKQNPHVLDVILEGSRHREWTMSAASQ